MQATQKARIAPVLDTGARRRRDKIMTKFSAFLKDEAGAVTVDWVVLTAAVVGLGLIVFTSVRPAVSDLAFAINTELADAQDCLESGATTC